MAAHGTLHLHGLLASGLDIMTRYCPDLPDALVTHMTEHMQWYTYDGYRYRVAFEAHPVSSARRKTGEWIVQNEELPA